MAVVQIGVVDVLVAHGLVLVPMRMRFADRPVVVLVVLVMDVTVLMFERLVFGSIERATVYRWGMVRMAKG